MTDRQKVREAFEAHILKLNPCSSLHRHRGGAYRTVSTERAWQLWQAAIAHASSATGKENLTVGAGEAVYQLLVAPGRWEDVGKVQYDADHSHQHRILYTHRAPSAEDARDAAKEEWRQINDAYSVSDQGRVMHADRVLHPYKKGKGYLAVSMWIDGVSTEFYVHRLVAEAFCLREHESQDQVNHRDGERTNNHAANLEWCTAKENRIHSAKVRYVGTRPVIGTNVVTGEEIRFESIADAEQHGFKRANIQKCISGLRKKHGGHYWREAIDQALAAERGEP